MILISGMVRFPEYALEVVRAEGAKMIEGSRQEPGCIDYAYSFDLLEPNVMRITERWDDRAALLHHFGTPHMRAWVEVVASIEHADMDLFMLDGERLKFSIAEWHAKAAELNND